MATSDGIGFGEALSLVTDHIAPLAEEVVPLAEARDRVTAHAIIATVDSPSVDAALKDGYAVRSADVAGAAAAQPVRLVLRGTAAAGDKPGTLRIAPGTAVRVLTGAPLPDGADAVVSEEFALPGDQAVVLCRDAEAGRNVLARGSDVARGQVAAPEGVRLTPGRIGLLAAAGCHRLHVVRRPVVAVLATGDEVVAPGAPLPSGKLYASNMAALDAWCRRFGWPTRLQIVGDDPGALRAAVLALMREADVLLTSGGAWRGDRDWMVRILEGLGWRQVFHRVRMGPGKATGFGLLDDKPVFVLPGGPPSNWMGFLQLALPGVRRLAGWANPTLDVAAARLARTITGRDPQWTRFVTGVIDGRRDEPRFDTLRHLSRLHDLAVANAVVTLPEGRARIAAGEWVAVQLLP